MNSNIIIKSCIIYILKLYIYIYIYRISINNILFKIILNKA